MDSVKPTIILVHGAFADASGWQTVIGLLQDDGYPVLAVQNALASLANDVETTKRAIDAQTGPVVVVGHSYGGAVMTGAAAGNPNVKALVFLSAFAPDGVRRSPPSGASTRSTSTRRSSQTRPGSCPSTRPSSTRCSGRTCRHARRRGWPSRRSRSTVRSSGSPWPRRRGRPSRAGSWSRRTTTPINPDLERFYAKRIGARTTEIDSSHVVFLSHPREVTDLIEEAATAAPVGATA